eukprot:TRINITY_DN7048_c0_g1_i1.p1 TRINITY_DN7048_c0_g1~~TRINITY_DN7048_c0_g1_i1.p1  ORF type:complete len:948 (+),score=126.41 TRINITY_DN7048_c0_g1_i1:68-2911(+)
MVRINEELSLALPIASLPLSSPSYWSSLASRSFSGTENSCSLLRRDVIFLGEDLPGGLSGRFMTASGCCVACEELEACAGWTHDVEQGSCWLKAALRSVEYAGFVSGAKATSSVFEVVANSMPPARPSQTYWNSTSSPSSPDFARSSRSQTLPRSPHPPRSPSSLSSMNFPPPPIAPPPPSFSSSSNSANFPSFPSSSSRRSSSSSSSTGSARGSGSSRSPEARGCTTNTGRPCPNILYLMADDMRPQTRSYGQEYMITPNLDALARGGLQFDFAYAQFAFCAPSRNSFFSGRRPDQTRALNFLRSFRDAPGAEHWISLPQYFKERGYFTSSAGKLFHQGMDDELSWSFASNQTPRVICRHGDLGDSRNNFCGITRASAMHETDEEAIMKEGMRRMQIAHDSGKPWWIGIGVHRPHTPYRLPSGFHGDQLYGPRSDGKDVVAMPKHPHAPEGAPSMSGNWAPGDIEDEGLGCRNCLLSMNATLTYRRWYYAAVSWADYSLGLALQKLQELGPEVVNNTIVVFHSDHGYQLGELNEWSKKTNTELAVHVPLIIRAPWKVASIGRRTTVITELLDVYKTLVELAGFEATTLQAGVHGVSVASLFDMATETPPELVGKVAFSQIGRCGCDRSMCGQNACCKVPIEDFDYMGYTVRTEFWRFSAWVPFDKRHLRADWNKPTPVELYDLHGDDGRNFDFDGYSTNVADRPENQALISVLKGDLRRAVESWQPEITSRMFDKPRHRKNKTLDERWLTFDDLAPVPCNAAENREWSSSSRSRPWNNMSVPCNAAENHEWSSSSLTMPWNNQSAQSTPPSLQRRARQEDDRLHHWRRRRTARGRRAITPTPRTGPFDGDLNFEGRHANTSMPGAGPFDGVLKVEEHQPATIAPCDLMNPVTMPIPTMPEIPWRQPAEEQKPATIEPRERVDPVTMPIPTMPEIPRRQTDEVELHR